MKSDLISFQIFQFNFQFVANMKKTPAKTFVEGDLVFAKVRGYPAWPARVTCPADKNSTKFHVFFYGTYETAVCKKEELWLFDDESKAKFSKQKRKGFPEALHEIENTPEIAAPNPNSVIGGATSDAGSSLAEVVEAESSLNMTNPMEVTLDDTNDHDPEIPLVIDESSKPTSIKKRNRGTKRKADESPAADTHAAVKPVQSVRIRIKPLTQDSDSGNSFVVDTPTTPLDEKISRSGRVIKPKKFVDDSPKGTPVKSPDPKSEFSVEPRKLLLHLKVTDDIAVINLDKNKGEKSGIDKDEHFSRALKFKDQVESGECLPTEMKTNLEKKENRTTKEESALKREKISLRIKEQLRFLHVEQKLIDIDFYLKKSVHYESPDMEMALKHLQQLETLAIAPLMLKKQPEIVTTIQMLRNYVGPINPDPDPIVNEKWKHLSEKIRNLCKSLYGKIQGLFSVAKDETFLSVFEKEVDEFHDLTKNFPHHKRSSLVVDPNHLKHKRNQS